MNDFINNKRAFAGIFCQGCQAAQNIKFIKILYCTMVFLIQLLIVINLFSFKYAPFVKSTVVFEVTLFLSDCKCHCN